LRVRSLFLVAILLVPLVASAQKSANSIAGTWEGESICTVRDSPCHDEHVIYEIAWDTTEENNPDHLGPHLEWKMDAYKIVNGEKQFMGSLPCSFDEKKRALSCAMKTRTEDYWEFIFDRDTLRGTLHVGTEKTLFRNVSAKRISKS
jgi:hypothetical protein